MKINWRNLPWMDSKSTKPTSTTTDPAPAPTQETKSDMQPSWLRFDHQFGSGIAETGKELWGSVTDGASKATGWLELQANEIRHRAGDAIDSIQSHLDTWRSSDSAGKAGWLKREVGDVKGDATTQFKSLEQAAKSGENVLPPDANQYKYLVVDGLFTERYPGYMSENIQRLEERGLSVDKVAIDTDAGVAQNAEAVRKAVLEAAESGQQVVLLGHSKGGVDATAALSLYPELKPHVRAVVAMQSPYGGTPIASDIHTCEELKPVANSVIENVFSGDSASLQDLTYQSRRDFLLQNPYPADEVPTISLATSSSSPLSVTAKASHYIEDRYGWKSDGLVVDQDAEIPGSHVVRLQDLDHAGPTMSGVPGVAQHEPGALTEALVALALSVPKPN